MSRNALFFEPWEVLRPKVILSFENMFYTSKVCEKSIFNMSFEVDT